MKRKHRIKRKRHNHKNIRSHHSAVFILYIIIAICFLSILILSNKPNKLNILSNAGTGGFHLTEEVYGKNVSCGIDLNIHVKFNFEGCDGDITLYKDDKLIGGPNAWNSFGGKNPFDYNESYTASPVFIPNDGKDHSITYKGAVNRCPKSTGTLWDEISCTVTFDDSNKPVISPSDLCEIKNLSEIRPAEKCLALPTSPDNITIPDPSTTQKPNLPS